MILMLSDIHGDVSVLDQAVELGVEHGATAIIQVGDFGWSHEMNAILCGKNYKIPVFAIEGNHEDFGCLEGRRRPTEMAPNVFYMPRGTVMEIDGKVIGFCGGASSVDKAYQETLGKWDAREVVTCDDIAPILSYDGKIDMLVTHCPPQSVIQKHFDPMVLVYNFGLPRDWRDPSADVIEYLWEQLGKPPLYCGHMHRSLTDGNVTILNINEAKAVK